MVKASRTLSVGHRGRTTAWGSPEQLGVYAAGAAIARQETPTASQKFASAQLGALASQRSRLSPSLRRRPT